MSKNNRKFILIAVFAVLLGVAIVLGLSKIQSRSGQEKAGDSTGLVVGRNAIYAPDQASKERVKVGLVYLERPGFVVVHEDKSERPGAILGESPLLPRGETKNIFIALLRPAAENETLHAMLHIDDGDGLFDPLKDAPAIDEVSGKAVTTIFVVSKDFSEPSDIQL